MKYLKKYEDWSTNESNDWKKIKKEFGATKSEYLSKINNDIQSNLESLLEIIMMYEIHNWMKKNSVFEVKLFEMSNKPDIKSSYTQKLSEIKKLALEEWKALKTSGEIKSISGALLRKLMDKIKKSPVKKHVHLAFHFDIDPLHHGTKRKDALYMTIGSLFRGSRSFDFKPSEYLNFYWVNQVNFKINDLYSDFQGSRSYRRGPFRDVYTQQVNDFIAGKSNNSNIDNFFTNEHLAEINRDIENRFVEHMLRFIYVDVYKKEKLIITSNIMATGSVGKLSGIEGNDLYLYELQEAEYWIRVLAEYPEFFEKYKDRFTPEHGELLRCQFHISDIEDMKINGQGKYNNINKWFSITLSIVLFYLKLFPQEKDKVYKLYFQVFENVIAVCNVAKDKQDELDALFKFIDFYKENFPELYKLACEKLKTLEINASILNWIRSNHPDKFELLKQQTKQEDQWGTDLQADAGEYGL